MNKINGIVGAAAMTVALSMASSGVLADEGILNTVSYDIPLKQWVTLDSAEVTVSVDASSKNQNVAATQEEMMRKIGKINPGVEWHIVDFSMTQDKSGLNILSWQMQARLPWKAVSRVQNDIANLSTAGQQYAVQSISFSPSIEQTRQVMASLRETAYEQVKKDLQQLNATGAGATPYFLHRITFRSDSFLTPRMQNIALVRLSTGVNTVSAGQEVGVIANVEFAASPQAEATH